YLPLERKQCLGNWNETIQKTVNYGCTVLINITEWKWKNRTELDLLAIKQLNDVDMETGSKNHKNRGFDYKVAKEKILPCSEDEEDMS
ncbi:secretory glyco k5-like protein, partial [Schistosoma japonicum]